MKAKIFRVGAVQMRFQSGLAQNVARIKEFIRDFAQEGGDAILFPECAVTGYNRDWRKLSIHELEKALEEIARAAKANACNVLVGCPTLSKGRWFNSLVAFNRQGQEIFRYSKIHLTPRDREFF